MNLLYVNTGQRLLPMLKHAVESAKRHNPDCYIQICTDIETGLGDEEIRLDPHLLPLFENRLESIKILGMLSSTLESYIYLDIDTTVLGSLQGFWSEHSQSDIVFTNQARYEWKRTVEAGRPENGQMLELTIPSAINAGVIGINNATSDRVRDLFRLWIGTFIDEIRAGGDNWTGTNDQKVLQRFLERAVYAKLGVVTSFNDNKVFNATEGMWTELAKLGKIDDIVIAHSKVLFLRGVADIHSAIST